MKALKEKASKAITPLSLGKEFRVCPHCNYQLGFHVSFLKRPGRAYDIVLICPDCGSRYSTGWKKR